MHVQRRPDHSMKMFFRRTIAAQSHLIGCAAAFAGLIVLLQMAVRNPEPRHFWACLLFGVTAVIVFATSALYHFLHDGYMISARLTKWLEDLDHFAIYLFIAGTYTPFLINAVSPPWDTILLFVVWGTGITGIVYTHFKARLPLWAQHRFVYTGIFLLMGWALIVRIDEVFRHLSRQGVVLLMGGAVAYTIGAVIYATQRPRLYAGVFGFHELWHLMVMVGFGFHYFLILNFYLG